MISMTWSTTPADLLGLGSFDACAPCAPAAGAGVRLAAAAAPYGATGLPVGRAVRLRSDAQQGIGHRVVTTPAHESTTFDNNGTTLGYLPSRRPQS